MFQINAPVVDLRREPYLPTRTLAKDPLQETQLLFGEKASKIDEINGWIFIEAVEQPKFSEKRGWSGYLGWVQSEFLIPASHIENCSALIVKSAWTEIQMKNSNEVLEISFGTILHGSSSRDNTWLVELCDGRRGYIKHEHVRLAADTTTQVKRENLVNLTRQFLGMPYLWGGRSAFDSAKSFQTGMDCSSLVHLLYRTQGIEIPRDAHDQYLKSHKIDFSQMQMGDLIFLAEKNSQNPDRMSHVMLYIGEGRVIEATMESMSIREIDLGQKLGLDFLTVQNKQEFQKYSIHCGRVICD